MKLILPCMGDFERLHTWGGGTKCSPYSITMFYYAKSMKISEMIYHRKMRLCEKKVESLYLRDYDIINA